jgi:hypothetical protein
MFERLRAAESVGRPLGDNSFFARFERLTKRSLSNQASAARNRPNRKAIDACYRGS